MKKRRQTKATVAIKELIDKSDNALSHSDIQLELEDLCDRVTIYRVLDRLLEEGEIHKIIDVDGVSKFASCDTCEEHGHEHHRHDHIHFSCTRCGNVICLDEVKPEFTLPEGYKMKELNFTLSGTCASCNA